MSFALEHALAMDEADDWCMGRASICGHHPSCAELGAVLDGLLNSPEHGSVNAYHALNIIMSNRQAGPDEDDE